MVDVPRRASRAWLFGLFLVLGCSSTQDGSHANSSAAPGGGAGSAGANVDQGGSSGAAGAGGAGIGGSAGSSGSATGGAGGALAGGAAGSAGDIPLGDAGFVDSAFVPIEVPASERIKYNFDHDWKFIKQDVAGAEAINFDDSAWKDVSLPHTYNDVDHYDDWVTGGGDGRFYAGKTWYRKHFKLPAEYSGRKIFLEIEGVRQAGTFYVNGALVGLHENGVGPIGLDITAQARFGTDSNVVAVLVDSTLHRKEQATGTDYQWDTPPYNPEYGGIVKNAFLHVTGKVYQTLPLYSNLKTAGTYVYAKNVDIAGAAADLTVEAEVENESGSAQTVDLVVDVYDWGGAVVLTKAAPATVSIASGEKKILAVTGHLTGAHFWSPDSPYRYRVVSALKISGKLVDSYEIPFGIRKVTFAASEGLKVNGRSIYLFGYAPRSTTEWATIGQAPNWLEEYDFVLMKEAHANFVRPMHTAPKKADVDAADRLGFFVTVPAGDSEQDPTGRMWDQRVELMRDVTIYYRNHPSVIFYEAGNGGVSPDHMIAMLGVRDQWDPNGNRFAGNRTPSPETRAVIEDPARAGTVYWASMDVPATSAKVPVWDAEYTRQECPRRAWDKYSPPSSWTGGQAAWQGYKSIANGNAISEYPADGFLVNSSEDLARVNIKDLYNRWSKRTGKPDVMVGGAKIIFADSVSHGRLANVEVARVSGAVDAARLPKETYFALQAAENPDPQVHVLGHWTYPAGTVKTVYVISNCDQVELSTYDSSANLIKSYGKGTQANGFEFSFAGVAFQPGRIEAVGYRGGARAATYQIVTAGPPAKIVVTPRVGPAGFRADGSDIAMFDVEVVDASGVRCPNDEARVDFTYNGEGAFLGGYNSGVQGSLFKDFLSTEQGVNRVFVRATRKAGDFALTASRAGLAPGSAKISSAEFHVVDGLTTVMPQGYPAPPVR
jgi:beta-galactosidase